MFIERSDTVSLYLDRIRDHGILDRERESELARESLEGCEAARRTLVEKNLGFVVVVAKEFRRYGVPFEDLLGEGNLGLLEAARRFDPSRGVRFTTYAVFWVRKAILEALTRHTRVVRLPNYQVRRNRSARGDAARSNGATPTPRAVPLDADSVDGTRGLLATLADPSATDPEARTIEFETTRELRLALSRLSPKERIVLHGRFGLDGGGSRSLQEVGQDVGLSRERVRQIEARAVERLRRALVAQRRIRPRKRSDARERPSSPAAA